MPVPGAATRSAQSSSDNRCTTGWVCVTRIQASTNKVSCFMSVQRRGQTGEAAPEAAPEVEVKEKNPLELNAALLFALMFVTVSLVTKYVLLFYKELGLRMLSFLVGASDIVPFIVSVLQGNLGIGPNQILQAIVIATASNNVMKTAYVFTFGHRQTARLTALGMAGIVLLSFLYAGLAL